MYVCMYVAIPNTMRTMTEVAGSAISSIPGFILAHGCPALFVDFDKDLSIVDSHAVDGLES